MIYTISDEFILIVLGFVESDNTRYIKMFEHLEVVLGGVAPPLVFADVVEWTHERDKLIRDYPVQVTVLDFFVVLILFVVELSELVPSKTDCILQSLQAVKYRARITAL